MRGVSKRFVTVQAVDGSSFSIDAGQIVGLVGQNGAGKSTLIRILAGLIQPDEGEVRIDGESVRPHGAHEALALGLSFVHQELVDVPELTVAENIGLGLGYVRRRGGLLIDWGALRERARESLERLGVAVDPRATVGSLSVADRRLVLIARALAANARLLVLDEPSASLTDREIEHLHATLRTVAANGVAVIYVTHRLEELFGLTDRIIVMRDGRVVADEATTALNKGEVVGLIGGRARQAPRHSLGTAPVRALGTELLRIEEVGAAGLLEPVSFTLKAGEILGLAGLVGAGRTTLARLLVGADRRTSGRITVKGSEVRIKSPRSAMLAGLVLLPEDRRAHGGIATMSIAQNITLPTLKDHRRVPRLPSPSPRSQHRTAQDYAERLQIKTASTRTPLAALSGGNQQKVVLAKWLARQASVLIFDEPTHGIDVGGKREIYAIARELADAGQGVIFISSEFEEIVEVCDRALVLVEGRLAGEIDKDNLSVESILAVCYGHDFAVSASGDV